MKENERKPESGVFTGDAYPTVFSTYDLGVARPKNRIVFPPWQLNYANTDGTVSDKLLEFNTALALGGCGIIITGCAVVSEDTVAFDRVMRIDDDRFIPGLRELFNAIEKRGSVPAIQLVHYGRQALSSVTGCELQVPSAIPCPVMSRLDPQYKMKEMTREDIVRMAENFIDAAERAAKAGAKMVEVHAAHGYLLNQFLSPYSNCRTDEYGGSTVNRTRLVADIIKGIRKRLGRDVIVSVRVSGNEFVEGGLTPRHYLEIIPILEEAGMDVLNVSAGVYQSMERMLPPDTLGDAPHVSIASELKRYASVPVCAVGSIFSLATAEAILAAGDADFVAMGRAQMADPEIVRKSLEGRETEVRQCIWCNNCAFWASGDPHVFCSVNPAYQKEE